MNEKLIKILIKKLENDISDYCGDYGTLENRVETTLELILDILKVMNNEIPFEDWYLKDLMTDYDGSDKE